MNQCVLCVFSILFQAVKIVGPGNNQKNAATCERAGNMRGDWGAPLLLAPIPTTLAIFFFAAILRLIAHDIHKIALKFQKYQKRECQKDRFSVKVCHLDRELRPIT